MNFIGQSEINNASNKQMPLTPTLQYTRLVTPPQTGGSMTRLAIPYLWDGSTILIAHAWDSSTNEVHWLHYTDARSVFALLGGDPLLFKSHIFQYSSVDQEGVVSCWLCHVCSNILSCNSQGTGPQQCIAKHPKWPAVQYLTSGSSSWGWKTTKLASNLLSNIDIAKTNTSRILHRAMYL